jgi:hypothetical protein
MLHRFIIAVIDLIYDAIGHWPHRILMLIIARFTQMHDHMRMHAHAHDHARS